MTDRPLVDVVQPPRYQMQSWNHEHDCICLGRTTDNRGHKDGCPYPATTHSWVPMEDGAAAAHWRPKRDVRAAVTQAATWAGAVWGLGIPAMQVVEVPSGTVVWRDSVRYPDAGEPVAPAWQDEVYAAAKAEHAREASEPAPAPAPATTQESLF